MGIKGIYKEIGPGERISLRKLATEHLELTQRPLRLAIDISIWQFQVQAARGGSNPAIRTLFYRLARLLGNAIEPIFVFDGPNKPAFKRNKRSGRGDGVATAMAKRLIHLFGFTTHDAPGEAEAECALLQRQGIVDAVLSEDVDTIMFGCTRTLRSWSAEGSRGAKVPTHVTLYDAAKVAAGDSGLDREGMVLVALMSGGDYIPEGIPGCGVKVACEAARAGFGRDLCLIKKSDKDVLAAWKERLLRELRTNESRFFRTKHKALTIPNDFPSMEVLRYYTHPVVSRQENLERLERELFKTKKMDIAGMREFVRETFDWTYKTGAIKFIRVIAPSILVQRLVRRVGSEDTSHDDLDSRLRQEAALVKSISSRRAHFSTDSTPELRVSFIPNDIVGVDLDAEPEEPVETYGRSGLALNSDDEFEEAAEDLEGRSKSGTSKKPFDPLQPDLAWVPESVVRLGVPLRACDWADKQRAKELKAAARAKKITRAKKTDMPVGALDKYLKVTKNVGSEKPLGSQEPSLVPSPPRSSILPRPSSPLADIPQLALSTLRKTSPKPAMAQGRSNQPKKPSASTTQASRPTAAVNPWTIASSQASPRNTEPAAASRTKLKSKRAQEPIVITSSPAGASAVSRPPEGVATVEPTTPTRKQKRSQSPPTEDNNIPEQTAPFTQPLAPLQAAELPGRRGGIAKPASTRPNRQPRPFKRTKSGAEDNIQPASDKQLSMACFTRVGKASVVAPSTAKKLPIEIPSDDDEPEGEEDISLPLLEGVYRMKPEKNNRETPSTTYGLRGSSDSDDDPFGPTVSSPEKPQPGSSAPSSPRDSNPGSPSPTRRSLSGGSTPAPQQSGDEFDLQPPRATTKLFLPRTSGVGAGFFDEIEVTHEEADEIRAKGPASTAAMGGLDVPRGRKMWRRSEICLIDLTKDD